MSNENKQNKKDNGDVFEETFGELLNDKKKDEHVVVNQDKTLEEALFGEQDVEPLSEDEMLELTESYIPPSVQDAKWEELVSNSPISPLDREQEARAVSVGLQELRKTREYMLYIYRHMTSEFQSIYVTYPMLFQKYFEETFAKSHKQIGAVIDDMEHLIAGDIDKVEAVKSDFRLYQKFEQKRLSILYDILEHYNKK